MERRKGFDRVEVKSQDQGIVRAIFARFNVVDLDGDVTRPGAFTEGEAVRISAYQHESWRGALPVGKGVIHSDQTKAWVDAQFFMDTQQGRDTFTVIRELGDLQQWSYGFDVEKASQGQHEGKAVQFLEKLKVHEVSPVLLGAGIGTETVMAKSQNVILTPQEKRQLLENTAKSMMRARAMELSRPSEEYAHALDLVTRPQQKARAILERRLAEQRLGRAEVLLRRLEGI